MKRLFAVIPMLILTAAVSANARAAYEPDTAQSEIDEVRRRCYECDQSENQENHDFSVSFLEGSPSVSIVFVFEQISGNKKDHSDDNSSKKAPASSGKKTRLKTLAEHIRSLRKK